MRSEWFAIAALTGKEARAERYLRQQAGFTTFFPHLREWHQSKRLFRLVHRAWYPGYLFVSAERLELGAALTEEAKYFGVIGIVSAPSNPPCAIPDWFIERLMSRADPLGCMHMRESAKNGFAPGDKIRIAEGHALWNFRATVLAVDGEDLVIELDRAILGSREATIPARFAEVDICGE
jgi:transcription antitermination factor NusG